MIPISHYIQKQKYNTMSDKELINVGQQITSSYLLHILFAKNVN